MGFALIGTAGLAVTLILILNAASSMVFFYSPTQVNAGEVTQNRIFRLGGLVEENSFHRENDGLTVHFNIMDKAEKSKPADTMNKLI